MNFNEKFSDSQERPEKARVTVSLARAGPAVLIHHCRGWSAAGQTTMRCWKPDYCLQSTGKVLELGGAEQQGGS